MKYFCFLSALFAAAVAQSINIDVNNNAAKAAEISFRNLVLNLTVSFTPAPPSPYGGSSCVPKFSVVASPGLSISACTLDFTAAKSLPVVARLDYAFVPPAGTNEDLFVTFTGCGISRKFPITRKAERRYKCSSSPFIKPFDNAQSVAFQESGAFYLVRPNSPVNPTEVVILREKCTIPGTGPYNTGASQVPCTKAIAIRHLGSFVIFKISNNKITQELKGTDIVISTTSVNLDRFVVTLTDGSTIIVSLAQKTFTELNFELDFVLEYSKKIYGLCGNLDGVADKATYWATCRLPSSVSNRIFGAHGPYTSIQRFPKTTTPLFNKFKC